MFEEIKERFEFILESISLIETRFNKIRFPDDLIDSEDGMTDYFRFYCNEGSRRLEIILNQFSS